MSDGVRAKRDIVQFVPFNEFKNQGLDSLAAGLFFFKLFFFLNFLSEVLQEVPTQFLSYMKSKGIYPQQKIRVDSFSSF